MRVKFIELGFRMLFTVSVCRLSGLVLTVSMFLSVVCVRMCVFVCLSVPMCDRYRALKQEKETQQLEAANVVRQMEQMHMKAAEVCS